MTVILQLAFAVSVLAAFLTALGFKDELSAIDNSLPTPPAGPHPRLQATMFSWSVALASLLAIPKAGDGLGAPVLAAAVLMVGLTVHLTQQERAKKDGYGARMPPAVNLVIAVSYILGAAWSLSKALGSSNISPQDSAAMITLGTTASGMMLLFSLAGLKFTKGRPLPWLALGMTATIIAVGMKLLETQ